MVAALFSSFMKKSTPVWECFLCLGCWRWGRWVPGKFSLRVFSITEAVVHVGFQTETAAGIDEGLTKVPQDGVGNFAHRRNEESDVAEDHSGEKEESGAG